MFIQDSNLAQTIIGLYKHLSNVTLWLFPHMIRTKTLLRLSCAFVCNMFGQFLKEHSQRSLGVCWSTMRKWKPWGPWGFWGSGQNGYLF